MKSHYDENALDRNFESGDKELHYLLFCPFLVGLCKLDIMVLILLTKKLSDLNYIDNTLGRRKQKQLCHINMLKKYIHQ